MRGRRVAREDRVGWAAAVRGPTLAGCETRSCTERFWGLKRLVIVSNANTRHAKGLCLEPHDLCLSKYVAARDKVHRFTRDAAHAGLVRRETLLERLEGMPIDERTMERVRHRIEHAFGSAAR